MAKTTNNVNDWKNGSANPHFKDALFKYIFGNRDHKDYALHLYNALNGTNSTDPSSLKIVTLENVLYLNYKNDVGILVDATLNLWEGQSSWNPNMPYRFLGYSASEYEKIVRAQKLNVYGSTMIKLPTPKCVVIYTGEPEIESIRKLRLSDMYEGSGDIEVTVTVYNINTKAGAKILENCEELYEYAWTVDCVKDLLKQSRVSGHKISMKEAVDTMLESMPGTFILKDLLISEKERVISMLMTEFNAKEHDELTFRDGFNQGRAEAKTEGLKALISSLLPFLTDTADMLQAVKKNELYSDVTFETVESVMKQLSE